MIGRKLSNYHLNERLGEGGMGTVYKATDLRLNRTVAIKMLHPFLVNNPDSLRRFQNEAQLSARISHPNVATLYDFQEAEGLHFIVMEYVEGKGLDEVLQLQGKLSADEATKIVLQVLEGLTAAHELGIMHRDLKPANIMITRRGFVKLMDFGIARLENSARMTRQNSVIGTLEYLSPELVKGGEPSKSSDLYAVGVLLHEMLSGKTLYAGDSEAALMYNIAHKSPQFQLPGHTATMVQVVKKLTAKQPNRRYPSTSTAITDLEKIHRNGKVNPLLLEQKVAQESAIPNKLGQWKEMLESIQLPALPQFKGQVDRNVWIIGGACLLCLLILLAGFGNSSEKGASISGQTEQEVRENGEVQGTESDPDLLSSENLQMQSPKREIVFIERFEDEGQEEPVARKESKEKSSSSSPKKSETRTKPKQQEQKSSSTVRKKTSPKEAPKQAEKVAEINRPKEKTQDPAPVKVEEETSAKPIENKPAQRRTVSKSGKAMKVRIPDMYLSASFAETVSTETHSPGQTIYLQTSSPIYQGDHLIVERGAKLRAKITRLRPVQGKKKAFLAIQLQAVQAANNQWLAVSYPEYSDLSREAVIFQKGQKLNKIKLKSTNITLNP